MPRRATIIVAGGTGTRMNSTIAKQFIKIAGKPILIHTFEAFHRFDVHMELILVLHESLNDEWNALQEEFDFKIPHKVVNGGEERYHSVKNGINALSQGIELIGIHDAVRPLTSPEVIGACFKGAEQHGAAVPVVPVTDTIRQKKESTSITLPRRDLVAVQTPQCFNAHLLKSAYEAPFNTTFTDDASVVEHGGHGIELVNGHRTNIKITTPEDLLIAESFLQGGLNE